MSSFRKAFLFNRVTEGIKQQLHQDDFDLAMMFRFSLENLLLIADHRIFFATTYNKIDLSEEIFEHLIGGIATGSKSVS